MLRYLILCAFSLAVVGACSEKRDNKAVEPEKSASKEAVAVSAPAELLVIKAATLTLEAGDKDSDGPETIALDDKGHILIGTEAVGTLNANGSILDQEGQEIATLTSDGVLRFTDEGVTAMIGADGALSVDGEQVASFDANNMLVMADLDEKIKFEGPEEAKRAMMVVFLIASTTIETDDEVDLYDSSAEAPSDE